MMPRKPKHPCSYPGCSKLTDKRICEEHEKLSNSNYEKYGREVYEEEIRSCMEEDP